MFPDLIASVNDAGHSGDKHPRMVILPDVDVVRILLLYPPMPITLVADRGEMLALSEVVHR